MPDFEALKKIIEMGMLTVLSIAYILSSLWDKYQIKPLMINLTEATKALTSVAAPIKDFPAHDERSKSIDACQEEMLAAIHSIGEKMATKEELVRVHSRIDSMAGTMATQGQVQQIATTLGTVASAVSKIEGRGDPK